jgi:hypothetical protein
MKKSLVIKAERTMEKVRALTRHIRNVEDNCLILGERLIMSGEVELGHHLIANGFVHDASKFFGIEWEQLVVGLTTKEDEAKLKLKMAVHHHKSTNPHHPEFWGDIKKMPSVYLAECVSDWKSRSEEFGTSLKEWVDDEATKRFKFTKEDSVYKEISKYIDLLCGVPFKEIK